jgi:endoglucanase
MNINLSAMLAIIYTSVKNGLKYSQYKKLFLQQLVAFLCFLFFGLSPNSQASTKITDGFEQNRLLGRGINTPSADRINNMHFKLIKEAGFDNVRLPIFPFKETIGDKDFTLKPSFFKLIDSTVNLALSNNLMAIIDLHEHHAMQEDPIGNKARFYAIWEQLAEHYKNYPNEVLFEICNEPNMKPEIWNEIHSETYKIIRKSNPYRTLLIGTIYGNQIEFLKDLVLPENDRNIIVSIHDYKPMKFTHQGAEWSNGYKDLHGIEWTNTKEEEKALIDEFEIATEWAKANNRPLHLGEFGVYHTAGKESSVRWINFVARQAESRNWSWSYWEFCDGFGIFDKDKNEWRTWLLDALIPTKE